MKVSFWLIPSEKDRNFFQDIIDQLAETYSAPLFVPHVTLYSGEYTDDAALKSIIENAIRGIRGSTLKINRIDHSDDYKKALFIQFYPSVILDRISKSLRSQAIQATKYKLSPHLSLIYQHLDETQKQEIIKTLKLLKSEVSFNEIWAILTSDQVESSEDVESWKVLEAVKL